MTDACLSVSEERTASIFKLILIHLDAEVVRKKRVCQLCGKVGGNLTSRSSDWLHVHNICGRISDEGYDVKINHRKSSIIGKLRQGVHRGNISKNTVHKYT
jgi:hypothetical protein